MTSVLSNPEIPLSLYVYGVLVYLSVCLCGAWLGYLRLFLMHVAAESFVWLLLLGSLQFFFLGNTSFQLV